jgi:hypothetical protein
MSFRLLLLPALFGLILTNGYAQNFSTTIKQFAQSIEQQSESISSNRIALCDPDSIHGYFYEQTMDSLLVYRQIYERNGTESTTVYTYNGIPQMLESRDSTVFDMMGRPIFNELWEFNYDSMFIVLSERTYSFPHDGNVISEIPVFMSTIVRILNPSFKDNVAFDSLILYSRDIFTGDLAIEEKTVNHYSSKGLITETQVFNWDAFGTMDWFLYSNLFYYYDANGRLDYTEEYIWNGVDLTLSTREEYFYNAQDSLITVLTTNQMSGLSEQKVDIIYDNAAGTITMSTAGWDPDDMEWITFLSIILEYDELGRVEAMELIFDFFGSLNGDRVEYKYIMDDPCPDHAIIYDYDENGLWQLVGKYFFDPVTISSTDLSEVVRYDVYPNPATSEVTLALPQELPDHDLLVSVLSYSGQVLRQQSYLHPSIRFDTTGLPPGLYYVTVHRNGSLVGVEKLVVK